MTDSKTVRKVYPDLPAKDRELFRTIVSLSVLLLMSMQEQSSQTGSVNAKSQYQEVAS